MNNMTNSDWLDESEYIQEFDDSGFDPFFVNNMNNNHLEVDPWLTDSGI